MNEYQQKRIDELSNQVQELMRIHQLVQSQIAIIQKEHQQTRNIMEKLATISNLEWIEEIGWVNKTKLLTLKKEPR